MDVTNATSVTNNQDNEAVVEALARKSKTLYSGYRQPIYKVSDLSKPFASPYGDNIARTLPDKSLMSGTPFYDIGAMLRNSYSHFDFVDMENVLITRSMYISKYGYGTRYELYVYGLDGEQYKRRVTKLFNEFNAAICCGVVDTTGGCMFVYTYNVGRNYISLTEDIRIILTPFPNIASILHNIPIGSLAFGYTGDATYCSRSGKFAYETGYNMFCRTNISPRYLVSLVHQCNAGFGVLYPSLPIDMYFEANLGYCNISCKGDIVTLTIPHRSPLISPAYTDFYAGQSARRFINCTNTDNFIYAFDEDVEMPLIWEDMEEEDGFIEPEYLFECVLDEIHRSQRTNFLDVPEMLKYTLSDERVLSVMGITGGKERKDLEVKLRDYANSLCSVLDPNNPAINYNNMFILGSTDYNAIAVLTEEINCAIQEQIY